MRCYNLLYPKIEIKFSFIQNSKPVVSFRGKFTDECKFCIYFDQEDILALWIKSYGSKLYDLPSVDYRESSACTTGVKGQTTKLTFYAFNHFTVVSDGSKII